MSFSSTGVSSGLSMNAETIMPFSLRCKAAARNEQPDGVLHFRVAGLFISSAV
jgi:hypothetical protein